MKFLQCISSTLVGKVGDTIVDFYNVFLCLGSVARKLVGKILQCISFSLVGESIAPVENSTIYGCSLNY